MNVNTAFNDLNSSKIFKEWKKQFPSSYISHFYGSLDQQFTVGTWEVGYYIPEHDKIAIFVVSNPIEMKPESEVFKETKTIEELDFSHVTVSQQDALKKYEEVKNEKYSAEHLLKGFVILQKFKTHLMWNISYVTQSLKILNIKIDAVNSNVISEDLVTVVEQKSGTAPKTL
ncbi:MAG: hypothetical protein CMH61_00145 [Nanoarchaeota archaeon]|nr:hypothetical protein [Nanoarchaeota archaeon]|tara:strand:+ start:382 stop:897 length:516 start_codon:yes stop_codon:yes gene_type:complete